MQLVYFTKPLAALGIAGAVEFARRVGVDGLDLAVRPGHPVNPRNAGAALPQAAAACRRAGLALPMVSLPTDFVDPADPAAVTVARACAEAGVPYAKLGYFVYRGDYRQGFVQARAALERFAALAREHGMTFLYHTHSGPYYGGNCEAVSQLLAGLDPRHVAAYADVGHQALAGGPIDLALDAARDHLAALALKDPAYLRDGERWSRVFVPAGEGVVDWPRVFTAARAVGLAGPVSIHSEYKWDALEQLQALVAAEVAFYRRHLDQAGKE